MEKREKRVRGDPVTEEGFVRAGSGIRKTFRISVTISFSTLTFFDHGKNPSFLISIVYSPALRSFASEPLEIKEVSLEKLPFKKTWKPVTFDDLTKMPPVFIRVWFLIFT